MGFDKKQLYYPVNNLVIIVSPDKEKRGKKTTLWMIGKRVLIYGGGRMNTK